MKEFDLSDHHDAEIAIIGLNGRFPGAVNLAQFWHNLREGVESIRSFSDEALLAAGVSAQAVQDVSYVKAGGILDDVTLFAATFFDYSPREAVITDPQQRLFLECAWEAFESAGYDTTTYPGSIGVFAGTSQSKYLLHHLLPAREQLSWVSDFQLMLGNDKDYLPTRVSYKLNLRGPSVNVQTACSTSLVAIHLACQSLLNGECDMALAGGVSIHVPQERGYFYHEGGINSPDGHCRPFDAQAQGTIGGNGIALVVLKRLEEAVADGDTIHAIIKGSAINNDGWAKVGYTAPSINGQAAAITDAIALAQIDPHTITYVEAHGTATPLGDPIEIAALAQAFHAAGVNEIGTCAIGALKSNIGHLDAAAGAAGLIKTVLALQHRQIPPSLHFSAPNPKIDFAHSPFYVNTHLTDWPNGSAPRRAGVSSFGIGGTNAHLILEEAPRVVTSASSRPVHLLLLSAKTETALEAATDNLVSYLQSHPDVEMADAAYTLQVGRAAFAYRRMFVCHDRETAVSALANRDQRQVFTAMRQPGKRPIIFMFPGQGAQYIHMARGLYETETVFRECVDRCAALLQPHLGQDIRSLLYPEPDHTQEAAARLAETAVAQPALFTVSYALAQQWMAWGVQPEAMIGHSVGEYVAACLSGVFTLEDALVLIAARGRMMQLLPAGAMLAVSLSAEALVPYLHDDLALAGMNAPNRCVVSGTVTAVESLADNLNSQGISSRRLHISHAFHSPMMTPILDPFARQVERTQRRQPTIPFISNVTGTWITPAQATDPRYWADHLRQPVRFAAGIQELSQDPTRIFLEVGPGTTLTALLQPQINSALVYTSSHHPQDSKADSSCLFQAVGHLWLAGVGIDWTAIYTHEHRTRIPLPTYPFERQHCWIDPPHRNMVSTASQPLKNGVTTMHTSSTLSERQAYLISRLQALFGAVLGLEPEQIAPQSTFFELGADSLLLIQGSQAVEKTFSCKVPFRLLLEEFSTIAALAAHLDKTLPPDAFLPGSPAKAKISLNGTGTQKEGTEEQPQPQLMSFSSTAVQSGTDITLAQVVQQQLQLMAAQIDLLRQGQTTPNHVGEHIAPLSPPSLALAAAAQVDPFPEPAQTVLLHEAGIYPDLFVPYGKRQQNAGAEMTTAQEQYLADFIGCYTARTKTSRQLAQTHRPVLADNRASAGFRTRWKELTYLITADRAQDARLWDVDGNTYIDLTMGFGVHLFGHSPIFIQEALQNQLVQNLSLGAQTDLAGQVAARISQMTGVERVAFANSGTEAVMTALRLARAVTGRSKIAFFTGSYHGSFDGTLAQLVTRHNQRTVLPLAPGVPASMVADVLLLDYNTPEALAQIQVHGHELAAILVEPVQSRRPDVQPQAFLQELRHLADETGAALIFDEIITGFRVHPGGAQAVFGVQADLVTYGKVIGGGLPVGVVAGKSTYMDAIDGGMWQFGDDSFPSADQTFFAGTFCKHPLSMAACLAALTHLQTQGGVLQASLTQRTADLAAQLNAVFTRYDVPIRVVYFGSLFRFLHPRDLHFVDLFFYLLRYYGLYIWEGRTCFLSTAHTDEDISTIVRVVAASVQEMQKNGFFPDAARTLPLTDAQQQLWFLTQIGDDVSQAYNEASALRLRGQINVLALQQALQAVVARHEALRATFHEDKAIQTIHPWMPLPLPLVAVSELIPVNGADAIQAWLAEQAREPFDLIHGSAVRAHLLRLAEDDHVLLLVVHHLVADGWSMGVLWQDITAHYNDLTRKDGKAAAQRQEDTAQFSQYVDWLIAQEPMQAVDQAYWTTRFADLPPVLTLPADHLRPPLQTYHGRRQSHVLPLSLADRLKAYGRSQNTTLYIVLLAAYQLLLHRLTAQDDVIVGIPIAGQALIGSDSLVGHCVRFLPLRSQLAGSPTFAAYLAATKQELLQATEHQSYPLHQLIKQLNLPRDPARQPLISATFNLDRDLAEASSFIGLSATTVPIPVTTAKFEISLNVVEATDGLYLDCDYNSGLFLDTTVQRWLGHFQTLLEAIVADPEMGVGLLPLLTPGEQQAVCNQWETTVFDQDSCLHDLFVQQVVRTPTATALVCEGEVLTYQELNTRANQLANYLQAEGVGPGAFVALYLERSLDVVVAVLAVLKTGAAYVPIDPAYPAQRIATILEETASPILLTQQVLRAQLSLTHTCQVLCLDADWPTVARCPAQNLVTAVSATDTAYVIYTSGSTGKPKGVMVSHANVVRLFTATADWFHFSAEDVWTLFHSYAFDFSVWEMWGALLYGGRLVIVPYWVSRSPETFYKLLVTVGVTVLNQTPSAFRQLIQAETMSVSTSALALRLVIFGGEALALQSLYPWFERHGDQNPQLVNMYGITETTVHVTYRPITMTDLETGQGSMIGWPIPDLSLYLLDAYQQPVPIGVVGEIYVGGAGVSQGYLHRPDLTAARFLDLQLPSGAAFRRCYRTGDLGRLLPNGDVEYLGRIDQQVKVRGFRIELGEIEAALNRHTAVQESIVMARPLNAYDKQLVAYLVAADTAPTPHDLRQFLQQRLPAYMVPAAFVFLDALPLTTNGKINREALPLPQVAQSDPTVFVPARTPTEAALAAVWAEALDLPQVSVIDNFFDLGGDSIRSIRVRALAQMQGCHFSIQQLFQHPTVAALAQVVTMDRALNVLATAPFDLISESDRDRLPDDVVDAYPLARGQAGMLFRSQYDAKTAVYHNVNTLHLKAPFDLTSLQIALAHLAERHPMLRTSIHLRGYSQPLQLVHQQAAIPLQIDDWRQLDDAAQATALSDWIAAERKQKFDWTQPPLLRFHVQRRSADTFQLGWTEHHAILDGWSMESLLAELFQEYIGLIRAYPVNLTAPSSLYRDFVAQEQAILAADAARSYWQEQLADAPVTALPHRTDALDTAVVRSYSVVLPTSVMAALRQMARQAGVPLKSVMLAAHIRIMSLLTGQSDIVTGVSMNGRLAEPDGEQALGVFVNVVPFRFVLRPQTWQEFVQTVWAAEQERLPFHHYPLAELQTLISREALFTAVFNYIHFHVYREVLALEEIAVLDQQSVLETDLPLIVHCLVSAADESMRLHFDYQTSLFSEAQIMAMSRYYLEAFAVMSADSTRSYHTALLLPPPERQQLLTTWNDTTHPYPRQPVQQLFAAHAARSPQALAVADGQTRLTYGELNQRANQLAHYLRLLGVSSETPVALVFDRTPELIIAALAVLKAGGAYVPLDLNTPPERLAFMLADAQVRVLLSHDPLPLTATTESVVTCALAVDAAKIAACSEADTAVSVFPDQLAYIIYTSGSTGTPKGVAVPHRGLMNLVAWHQRVYEINTDDRATLIASPAFDASVWELWPYLAAGASLHIPTGSLCINPERLVNWLVEQAVTISFLPTPLAEAVLVVPWPQDAALRLLLTGGDRLHQPPPSDLPFTLVNNYGPTENSVVTTWTSISADVVQVPPPIGRPVDNGRVYILDAYLQPVPVGTCGELYIAGDGLARGYVRRSALTAVSFIPHPFAALPGQRLYRTGDLACYLPDGQIEFRGRADDQTKIRGFRIELGEVEAVLGRHPEVREATVLPTPQGDHLVAFIVSQDPSTPPTLAQLNAFARTHLPDYMLPAQLLNLEALPLTLTGKINRQMLLALLMAYSAPQGKNDDEPCTPVEQGLVSIWSDVLGVDDVGLSDDFFTLGGHSLKATQIAARVYDMWQVDLPLRTLFDTPTIAALAVTIEEMLLQEIESVGM